MVTNYLITESEVVARKSQTESGRHEKYYKELAFSILDDSCEFLI